MKFLSRGKLEGENEDFVLDTWMFNSVWIGYVTFIYFTAYFDVADYLIYRVLNIENIFCFV